MFHRQPVALYCLCMGVGLLGVLGSLLPIFSDAEENLGLDLLYILRGPEKTRADVLVVAIDSQSAGALDLPLDPHRWPRRLHSQLIEQLTARQAAVVAFDLLFQEPQEEGNDQAFAAAMRSAGNVVLTQAIHGQTMPIPDRNGAPSAHVTIERVISAIPVLADAAIGQAPFPLPKVPIKLNQFWCFRSASGNVPTLPVVAFHLYAKDAFLDFIRLLVEVDKRAADRLAIPREGEVDLRAMVRMIRPLRLLFEDDATLVSRALERLEHYPSGKMSIQHTHQVHSLINLYGSGDSRYLNFYGPAGTIRTISYHRLVKAAVLPQTKDEIELQKHTAVFVGQTDSNWIKTHDGFYTAFSGASGQDISGVEIAATAFSNLLEDKGVYPLGPSANLFLLLGWGILMVSVSLFFPTAFSATGLLLLNGSYFYVAFVQFKYSGIWYPLVVPILLQSPIAFIAGLIFKYRKATIERQNIREAFGHYLPDEVVDRLSTNLKSLRLGGQVFYGVCLFTDAQNYTTLSESLDPGSLTELMNAYYETVFRPIKANGGLVLQVVGDSVMALWTASEPKYEIKYAACLAAVEITAAVDRFNRRVGAHAMPTRIGIHAGDMLLGNIGAMDHFEYRPVGDIVNTASRLEGLNKFLGTHVLVSQEAIGPDNGFMERSVGRFVFKGKSQPVHVHELLPQEQYATDEKTAVCRMFASGLAAFQHGRWDEANDWFDQVLGIDPTDGPSLFYIERCRGFRHAPPDGDWDGVVHLDRK
jgi:adenylate cyclase